MIRNLHLVFIPVQDLIHPCIQWLLRRQISVGQPVISSSSSSITGFKSVLHRSEPWVPMIRTSIAKVFVEYRSYVWLLWLLFNCDVFWGPMCLFEFIMCIISIFIPIIMSSCYSFLMLSKLWFVLRLKLINVRFT